MTVVLVVGALVLAFFVITSIAGSKRSHPTQHNRLDELLVAWRALGRPGRPPMPVTQAFLSSPSTVSARDFLLGAPEPKEVTKDDLTSAARAAGSDLDFDWNDAVTVSDRVCISYQRQGDNLPTGFFSLALLPDRKALAMKAGTLYPLISIIVREGHSDILGKTAQIHTGTGSTIEVSGPGVEVVLRWYRDAA